MSKLNVNEIEATSTNTNVKILTKGTDAKCDIKAATNDAVLQLNCSENSHGVKLKAPANTAGQNYTMILPDNQIAANDCLTVKSITGGSGVNAVGQLEFNIPAADTSSLDGAVFNSGTISSDRYNLTGSQGGGLQLIQKINVTQDNTYTALDFTGLLDGGMYRIIGKEINYSANTYPNIYWLKEDGSFYNNIHFYRWDDNDDNLSDATDGNQDNITANPGVSEYRHYFEIELSTKTPSTSPTRQPNWMIHKGHARGTDDNKCELYAYFESGNTGDRIHGIRFTAASTSYYFQSGTQILLYKYNED